MLDRKHERGGDRGADLDVALVVPALTPRDEKEATAALLTEPQWHAEQRSVARLDDELVTPAPEIQLTRSVSDEKDVAATDALQNGIILDGRCRGAAGKRSADDAHAVESLSVSGQEVEAHHVEIDQWPHGLAKPLQNVSHLEAGSEDRRQCRGGRQALTAARAPAV